MRLAAAASGCCLAQAARTEATLWPISPVSFAHSIPPSISHRQVNEPCHSQLAFACENASGGCAGVTKCRIPDVSLLGAFRYPAKKRSAKIRIPPEPPPHTESMGRLSARFLAIGRARNLVL